MAAAHDIDAVRTAVRALLEESPAYQALSTDAKLQMANDMVRVADYLADGQWLDGRPQDQALADSVDQLKQRLADKPGQVGAEFQAGAMKQGVEQFGQLVNKVDFPGFVSGLVKGVFNAVVDASIQQMQAYGEMLAAVAKSVDQFAHDNISDAHARDHVLNKYPSQLTLDTSVTPARVRQREDVDSAPDLGKDYGLDKAVDLADDDSEQALINAAKLEMARQKQQLLASMVLLGINRIVVTDGRINAKVIFDIQANDQASRRAQAEMHDARSSETTVRAAAAAGGLGWGAAMSSSFTDSHVATVASAVDDTSESRAQMKANLTGEVRLNFKSETFPLEKMVDTGGMQMLTARAAPTSTTPAPAPKPPTGAAR